jgi:hypothetical protein
MTVQICHDYSLYWPTGVFEHLNIHWWSEVDEFLRHITEDEHE